MQSNVLMISLFIFTIIMQAVVIGFMIYLLVSERKHHRQLEIDFVAALIAKSLPEMAGAHKLLSINLKDRIREIKAENDLALGNEKLLRTQESGGIKPGTAFPVS